jgi:hypothetical protein
MQSETVRGRYERHFLRNDIIVVACATVMLTLTAWAQPDLLLSIPAQVRHDLYVTGAGIAAALMGFVLVSVTLVVDLTSPPKATLLRRSLHFPQLYETFMSTTRYLGFLTVVLVFALAIDRSLQPSILLLFFVAFGTLASTARLARCVWILSDLTRLAAKE